MFIGTNLARNFLSTLSWPLASHSEVESYLSSPRPNQWKFGIHVELIYYFHSIVIVFFDLIAMILILVLLFSPNIIRSLAIYDQIFKTYDRTHAFHYQLFSNLALLLVILLYLAHIVSIGVAILGVRRRKPLLCVPQLAFLMIRIGLLLVLSASLILTDVVINESLHASTVVTLFFLLCPCLYLISTILCFRWVLDEWSIMQKILAAQKSVRFKRKKQRK